MAPREDLNLPEEGSEEAPAADSSPEGTEQEVPEPAMAAAVPDLSSTSKMSSPGPESKPPVEEAKESVKDSTEPAPEESTNHRASTFLTEVEDCDDVVPEVGGKVEGLGVIEDVDKKETTPAKEVSPAPTKEENVTKESSPAPVKQESPAPVKQESPAPVEEKAKETLTETIKETSQILSSEPIGAVEDLKAEVSALLSSSDEKKDETESVEVIDIAVVNEPQESANKSETQIEDVLKAIPEKDQIIEEAKESLKDIDVQSKETGSVIDISVIQEPTEEVDAQDVVKAAQEAFVAEVIPDNVDVEIVPDDGEEVIEYTLNAADAIPIGAIAVATFAIFLALIFYYN